MWHYYPASFSVLPCCCYSERRSSCVGRADGRDFLYEGEWEIAFFARSAEEADSLFRTADARLISARFTRAAAKEEYSKELRAYIIKAVYRCVYDIQDRIYQ